MKQSSFDLNLSMRRTCMQVFLEQMDRVVPWVPWVAFVELIAPYYSEVRNAHPPFPPETMLHFHVRQQWFSLSDPVMEDALFGTPLYREFAQLSAFGRMLNESTILWFHHRLEKYKLAEQIMSTVNQLLVQRGLLLKVGTAVDATLIPAPSSTKNKAKARDPEMHSSQRGKQWLFGMKPHIGVDADLGLVHPVRGTSGNVTEGNSLLHGQETNVYGDAGYRGVVDKRPDAKASHKWQVAMCPGTRIELDKESKLSDALIDHAEKIKAGIRTKVEHPFRVIKLQFGFMKVRYRGLKKITWPLKMLFALSNLWMVRHKLGAQA